MSSQRLGISDRLRYLIARAKRINFTSVLERGRETARLHGKWTPTTVVDMLWQAGFHNVGFQDYVDYDFAILTRKERATFMTHPVSNQLSQKYDDPAYRHVFHDKVEFDRAFSDFLGREWLVVDKDNAKAVADFVQRQGTVVSKEPIGQAGTGVHRYHAADVADWDTFHADLYGRGELLLEEVITQHADLAAVCPGTVNTTRVTAFFDGETTHILAMAQKFGRGQVSDQMSFGGFYTMLDERGHSLGAGYDSHDHVYETHPDSGAKIADFQLPLVDEVIAFIDKVARVVPQVQYVGWDIVVSPTGPVLVEGNWGAGVYENKPSVTGVRTGHKPRYRAAIGF